MKKITLAGCVILKNKSILLLHRIKKDWFELPGGKVDKEETPDQTATRELQEELKCDVEIIRRLGEKDFYENGYTMRYIWLLAKLKKGKEPTIGEPEGFSEFKYIPLKELHMYKLSPNMQNLKEELEKKQINLYL